MVSSNGTVFQRDSINAPCCEQYSIMKTEDGTQVRFPLVIQFPNGVFECRGAEPMPVPKTYQEWLDEADQLDLGICVDGWRYSKTGILI